MIIAKDLFENMLNSPLRHLRGRVEIYQGSALALVCSCHDRLVSFKVERTGEKSKFFGYGISQKLTVKLLDKERELNITKDNTLEVEFGVDVDYLYPYPKFYVDDVSRDETTNQLTIVAYDVLANASKYIVSELEIDYFYTINQFAAAIAARLGVPLVIDATAAAAFETYYENGANFEGTETLREALNAIAEATQTIYYIDHNWNLTFKRLDMVSEPVATISKERYFNLNVKDNYTLAEIAHATELGDNLTTTTGNAGVTQYVRNNPFWELREDTATLLDNAIAAIGGLNITQFDCDWRGNYLLEIGDKIGLVTKDDNLITSFILDDVIEFNGSLKQKTQWEYQGNDSETASNPTSLGEIIKQTYAKVDKANKQIEMVASETSANKDAIATIRLDTESIAASVAKIEKTTTEALDNANNNIATLTSKVEAQITAEDVRLEITNELANGVNTVSTGKGYTFDDTGLTIEDINPDTNNVIKTTVSNNGMVVNANNNDVLTANDEGVQAKDLHATTYLIIGENSRFEDYNGRTGCFWIGG